MNDPTLRSLLRRAYAGPTPVAPAGFVTTLLARRARQRRQRQLTASALILLLASSALLFPHRGSPTPPAPTAAILPAPPASPAPDPALWLAVADRLDAAQRLARARRTAGQVQITITLERERAAALLLSQGDWRRRHGHADASAHYQRAATLFDGTRAAALARARLDQG